MRKFKIYLVAAAMASLGLVGSATPAQAAYCDDSIDDACRVAAQVICGVLAKGRPCLN
jgi:hypothetical protein